MDSEQMIILRIFFVANAVLAGVDWYFVSVDPSLLSAISLILSIDTSFLAGLFGSIFVYRVVFHRLRHFPGPFGAKVSKFWALKQAAETVQWNEKVRELHRKYGDFVRTGMCHVLSLSEPPAAKLKPPGPREISINRPSAIQVLYGPPSVLRKAPWYAQLSNDPRKCSINATRDPEDHRRRRRTWDRGLGAKCEQKKQPVSIQ